MDGTRSLQSSVHHYQGSGGGDGNDQPEQRRGTESAQRDQFQDQRMTGFKVNDRAKSQQKNESGNRGQNDKSDIDRTVQALLGAAVLAFREVLFIVAAHLRRDAGNIVSPA